MYGKMEVTKLILFVFPLFSYDKELILQGP